MNLTSIELREFAIKLRNYINFNELPIFIFPVSIYEDIKESTDHQQCSELTERRIILLAIFWRLGYFILLIPVFLVSEYLLETGMLLLLLSIVLLIYGGYFILGNTKGFRHIYCAYQDWEGKEMTPSLINWKSIGRIKSIIPGFFSVIGLACLIGYLITII